MREVDKVSKGTGTFRNEKINYKVIADKIYTVLSRHLSVTDEKPKSIVILRDGVSYGEEEKALCDNAKVDTAKLLDKDAVKTGVIDVAKSTAVPVRAAKFNGDIRSLENPDCGTYFLMNKKDALFSIQVNLTMFLVLQNQFMFPLLVEILILKKH